MSQPQVAQYGLTLAWQTFSVDLPTIDAWVKSNTNSGYAGNVAGSALSLYFLQDPTIIPMTTVTDSAAVPAHAAQVTVDGVEIYAEVAGAAGNVTLEADGTETISALVAAWNTANPSEQLAISGDGTQIPAAGAITLAGGADAVAAVTHQVAGQSDAQKIQAYWAALQSTSPAATTYTANKTAALYQAQAAAAIAFGQQLMAQFAGQNLQLGITAAGMTKTVRLAMQDVTDCLSTGSLIEAIAEIKAIPTASYDPTFITAARLLAAVNQLETFCGLTLSTSLS